MPQFVIAAAQCSSVKGDLLENSRLHQAMVRLAKGYHVDVVVFPELSLTGYEETIAHEVAVSKEDDRLSLLKAQSDELEVTIVAGCPIRSATDKPYIGAFVFRPGHAIEVYRKRYLDPSEEPFFVASGDCYVCQAGREVVGVAICADISHPAHASAVKAQQATVYAAGVAITPNGIVAAETHMATYAEQHGMLSVMANYGSDTGGHRMGGRSAIWNPHGELLARASETGDCLVVASRDDAGWRGFVAT